MPRFEKIPRHNWQHAREMRSGPTGAEDVLWRALRSYRLKIKFRRQHLIGPYIADFYAPDYHLLVEVDGEGHAESEQIRYDEARTVYFQSSGIRVMRFGNGEVLFDPTAVVLTILREVGLTGELPPLVPPLK